MFFINQRQSVKLTLCPTKEIVVILKNSSVVYRVLFALPVSLTPYRILPVRVGSDVRSYSKIVWGV
jgi:hypothetical protein